jgi:mannose-6-phosphate isomerase-like protein (cupin superfamily)
MIIKNLSCSSYFEAVDRTWLTELLHPERDGIDLPYSIAHAMLLPGAGSLSHRLKESSEVYIILEGEGLMYIESEVQSVHAGQTVLIPPGSWQHLQNTGENALKFLCIVHPFWRAGDEEVVSSQQ